MTNKTTGTFAERFITGLMTLFFMASGWFVLLNGGVSLKGKSGAVSFVDGNAGIAVAGFAFFIAALMGLMFARCLNLGMKASIVLISIIIVPPILFLVLILLKLV